MSVWEQTLYRVLIGLSVLVFWRSPMGADEPEWSTALLDCSTLDGLDIKGGTFRTVADGGPEGSPALVFDEAAKRSGAFEVDRSKLPAAFADYDELHFDLFQEGGITDVCVTLWGYPDDRHCRRWFSLKRFQRVGQWDTVRFDLNLDDDSSIKALKEPTRKLSFSFSKSPENAESVLSRVRTRIARVRLVKTLVRATLDPRNVTVERDGKGIFFHHPLELANRSGERVTARVEVMPEALDKFQVQREAPTVTLKPGETRTVELTLWLSAAEAAKLPAGHAEYALAKVTVPELPAYETIPIRGCRPVYLYAMVPPEEPSDGWIRTPSVELTDVLKKRLEAELDWQFRAPLDVAPQYDQRFRCAKCQSWLGVKDLYHFYCKNPKCEEHQKTIEVTKDDGLFASHLGQYHAGNAGLAKSFAQAFRASGDERFGCKAVEILTTYSETLGKLAMVGKGSTGWRCRLASAVIFLDKPLVSFTEAYLLMKDSPLMTKAQETDVRERLLLELLHTINQHFYARSAGQMEFILDHVTCAPAIGAWWYLADMLVGDGGWKVMLGRAFNGDGIGLEGGAYARRATYRMVYAAEAWKRLGMPVEEDRVAQIVRNSLAVGLYGASDPKPSWYDASEPQSATLPNTGFTILINGQGESWRKATVNWASSRDRGEHDLLSYDLRDDRELLIKETGRIAYGNRYGFLMSRTLAHNIPVVDEQDISLERKRQDYFHSDATAACCLIADTEKCPAYEGVRLSRALVLTEGLLLVVDRVKAKEPRVIDLPTYGVGAYGRQPHTFETSLKELVPLEEPLGKARAYGVPYGLGTAEIEDGFHATWSWSSRKTGEEKKDLPYALRAHFFGGPAAVFVGKSRDGWMAVERNFLVARKRGTLFTPACLYERTRGEGEPKVLSFASLTPKGTEGKPAPDGRALAYRIGLKDGRQVDLLISFDGSAYATEHCEVNAETRIQVIAAQREADAADNKQ